MEIMPNPLKGSAMPDYDIFEMASMNDSTDAVTMSVFAPKPWYIFPLWEI